MMRMSLSAKKEQESRLDENLMIQSLLGFAEAVKEDNEDLSFAIKSADCELMQKDRSLILKNLSPQSEVMIAKYRSEITRYIKEQTGYKDFFILTKCNVQPTKYKVYSPMEKYKYLKEKNPVIEEMFHRFDCEVDY